MIAEGQHIGYRKGAKGGTWIARIYDTANGRRFRSLAIADDAVNSDGVNVLSFSQAQDAARAWFAEVQHNDNGDVQSGPYTVQQAMEDYLADRERIKRKHLGRTRAVVQAHILPTLGKIELSKLTHGRMKAWRNAVAEAMPRVRSKSQRSGERSHAPRVRKLERVLPMASKARQAVGSA